jgi:hypothetical protein
VEVPHYEKIGVRIIGVLMLLAYNAWGRVYALQIGMRWKNGAWISQPRSPGI